MRLPDLFEERQQLAIEAERKRIAWELHDSAKQRVHAAHLVLSLLEPRLEGGERETLDQAIASAAAPEIG